MKLAPTCLNGKAVPLPSLRFVPSIKQVPGYNKAVSKVGIFGEGDTQCKPVSGQSISLSQPCIFTTCKSTLISLASFAISANSPIVSAYLLAIS